MTESWVQAVAYWNPILGTSSRLLESYLGYKQLPIGILSWVKAVAYGNPILGTSSRLLESYLESHKYRGHLNKPSKLHVSGICKHKL